MKNPLPLVQATVQAQTVCNYIPSIFAADQGVISQSLYRVSIPAVQKYLREHTPPIIPEYGEAYNHNNGSPHIEHVIMQIKELFRFAILYLLRNPNFATTFHFTCKQCLRLWGELFYLAIMIIDLKPAYNNPTIKRYEAYLQTKPDLRAIRLLPIFSTLYVLRRTANIELQSQQHDFWQLDLYVGPSLSVPGAICAAVLINGAVHIITTSAIEGVSDGGQVSVYPTADTSLNCLYEKDTAVQDPLAVVDVPNPPPILTPPVVPSLVPAAAIIQPAVDPVTTITSTDAVLLSSPETPTVEHQSTLSRPDATISIRSAHQRQCSFASDPLMPAQSLPPSTPPPPRGSRRRHTSTAQSSLNSAPTPPLDVTTSSSNNHHYDTRRKRNPLPSALHATAPQPLLTTSDFFAFSASLLLPPDQQSHYVDLIKFC
jgi:hypothetical protein